MNDGSGRNRRTRIVFPGCQLNHGHSYEERPPSTLVHQPSSQLSGTPGSRPSFQAGVSWLCRCLLPSSQKQTKRTVALHILWHQDMRVPWGNSPFVRPTAGGLMKSIIVILLVNWWLLKKKKRFPPSLQELSSSLPPEFPWIHSKIPDVLLH